MLSAGLRQVGKAGATRVVALAALAFALLFVALALLAPGMGTAEGAEPGTRMADRSGEPSSERIPVTVPVPTAAGEPVSEARVARADGVIQAPVPLPPGEILGRVFDAHGVPLRAIQVRASRNPDDSRASAGAGVSDRDGWYRIPNLPPGSYEVSLRAALESAGWTEVARVEVRSGESATADLAYRGERSLRAAFEFASAWEEMDQSMQTVLLRRGGSDGEVVARNFAYTRHEEPWCSGDVTFTGLEPGLYVLEVRPFLEAHQVWRRELDLTLADVDLQPQALHSDRVWRERTRVAPPEKGGRR